MAKHIFYRNYNKFANSQKNQLKILNQLKKQQKQKQNYSAETENKTKKKKTKSSATGPI